MKIFVTSYPLKVLYPLLLALAMLTASNCLAFDPDTVGTKPALAHDLRETTSLITAIVKVTGSLAVVVGLMLALIYLLKRSGFGKGVAPTGSLITVLESRMVAPKKYIAIVKIADKNVALGITDQTITMLTDVDLSKEASNPVQATGDKDAASFSGLLRRASGARLSKTTKDTTVKQSRETDHAQ